jgi:hypothetical protein
MASCQKCGDPIVKCTNCGKVGCLGVAHGPPYCPNSITGGAGWGHCELCGATTDGMVAA